MTASIIVIEASPLTHSVGKVSRETGSDENSYDKTQKLNRTRHRIQATFDVAHIGPNSLYINPYLFHVLFEPLDAGFHSVRHAASIAAGAASDWLSGRTEINNIPLSGISPPPGGLPVVEILFDHLAHMPAIGTG